MKKRHILGIGYVSEILPPKQFKNVFSHYIRLERSDKKKDFIYLNCLKKEIKGYRNKYRLVMEKI